ncbi:MAG TPA: 6-phosphogluconolactonase [Verrucomicrobiae bacterium]|nr:6-phosphogluconolactonase [Verrucomicrobiae bacterium]
MSYQIVLFRTADELASAAASQWLNKLQEHQAKPNHRQYNVALSGGRVAKNFFSEIVRQAARMPGGLFDGVHFFWADERCVPPDDPESNYNIARELLFEPLKIPTRQIHRLRGEGPEGLALREAVDDILNAAPVAKGQPVLEMAFLGMGEDGHVASLFPGEPEEVVKDEAVYRAVTAVKPPPRRITLGYAAIEAALEVWVMVSGAGKEMALRESLSPTGKTPMARVLQSRTQTKVFTDVKAS